MSGPKFNLVHLKWLIGNRNATTSEPICRKKIDDFLAILNEYNFRFCTIRFNQKTPHAAERLKAIVSPSRGSLILTAIGFAEPSGSDTLGQSSFP